MRFTSFVTQLFQSDNRQKRTEILTQPTKTHKSIQIRRYRESIIDKKQSLNDIEEYVSRKKSFRENRNKPLEEKRSNWDSLFQKVVASLSFSGLIKNEQSQYESNLVHAKDFGGQSFINPKDTKKNNERTKQPIQSIDSWKMCTRRSNTYTIRNQAKEMIGNGNVIQQLHTYNESNKELLGNTPFCFRQTGYISPSTSISRHCDFFFTNHSTIEPSARYTDKPPPLPPVVRMQALIQMCERSFEKLMNEINSVETTLDNFNLLTEYCNQK
ncbi:uncharacterized protein B0P05DRAFT_594789 [Gilbertella persicaria]|uniref:uncharacterized protein n=1 Tax=Gilbertella persicaria TaxID=101096 RepID=UPI00221E7818|nr:uncharacterized protein B0P05DRAFT_594789 [Gilbertella persicaria]KAI8088039.1 hypothetical protein B0P05DRAFT_594789 [Gilbertella persicaria]